MTTIKLPRELFDLIVDDLALDGDVLSLKACSLLCTSLRQTSQRHIFRRITLLPWLISLRKIHTLCFLFYRLITESPHIRLYVRTLVILDREMYSTPGRRRVHRWVMEEPTLPLVIRMLPNLEGFHLHARFGWEKLEPPLSSAISEVLSSSKITTVHFRGVNIPPACITQSPGLENIMLNDLSMVEDTGHAKLDVRINSLCLSPWTLKWFAKSDCPFGVMHLLKLRACPQHHSDHFESLQYLLNASAATLLEFEYLPFLIMEDMPPHLDLSRLRMLRSLVVYITIGRGIIQPMSQVIWLGRVLDTLPSQTWSL